MSKRPWRNVKFCQGFFIFQAGNSMNQEIWGRLNSRSRPGWGRATPIGAK